LNEACLTCNSKPLRTIRPYRTRFPEGRAIFGGSTLNECDSCGLVQVVPRPSQEVLDDYYRSDFRRHGYGGSDVADLRRFPRDNLFYYNRGHSTADLIARHLAAGSDFEVADVGAGYGHILQAMGERLSCSQRVAIETSAECVTFLEAGGLEVHAAPAEQVLDAMANRFDVVTMTHVLEHLLDPRAVLGQIRASLNDAGLLCVEVPNIPYETLLRHPDHAWAPRCDEPHITFFSRNTLTDLLERCGFEVLFADTAGPKYRLISALRFRLPKPKETLVRMLPRSFFDFLRGLSATAAVRVAEREECFFDYGGFRIWLRCIARKR